MILHSSIVEMKILSTMPKHIHLENTKGARLVLQTVMVKIIMADGFQILHFDSTSEVFRVSCFWQSNVTSESS